MAAFLVPLCMLAYLLSPDVIDELLHPIHEDLQVLPSALSYIDPVRLATIHRTCRTVAATPSHSAPPSDMSIAYLISAHDSESLMGAFQLLQEIYEPIDVFVVHVQRDLVSRHLAALHDAFAPCGANVVFVPEHERVDSDRASFGIVESQLAMLRVALRSPIQWRYALLLDGSTFPALSNSDRRSWLRSRPAGTSQTFQREAETGGGLSTICPGPLCDRTPARCVLSSDSGACLEMSVAPNRSPVARGSQWNRLSRELARWVLFAPEMADWIDFFRPTHFPHEHFFATVHWASPFRDQDDNAPGAVYMYEDEDKREECSREFNPSAYGWACFLDAKDLDRVRESGAPFLRRVASGDKVLRAALPLSPDRARS